MGAKTRQRIEYLLDLLQVHIKERLGKYLRSAFKSTPMKLRIKQRQNVSIVVVNFNTLFLIAHLLYSIYEKIEYKHGNVRIIVVDNASFDGSRDFLEVLKRNVLIDLVRLPRHRGHGPALRRGVRSIEQFEKDVLEENRTGTILTLDSDVIVLRSDLITDSIKTLYSEENIGMLGQVQCEPLADSGGYAHPSCLMIKREIYDLPSVTSFVLSGAPATNLHTSLRRKGYRILDFPYRERGYILHLGRGTINMVRAYGLVDNPSYEWGGKGHHYHGTFDGETIQKKEVGKFNEAIGKLKYPYDEYVSVLKQLKAVENMIMAE